MPQVEVFSWNPRRSRLPRRLARLLQTGSRVNNFGDLLGPLIVERILSKCEIDPLMAPRARRLLSVGSVLHFAHDNDVVWGSGVNGKVPLDWYDFRTLDVRAVRGPRTRQFLADRGIAAPAVFGDPALLLPLLAPELLACSQGKEHPLTIVPNFRDFPSMDTDSTVLNPRSPVTTCLERIARSEFVVGSSLHGIVVAESLGIPARLVASSAEHPFKYEDYYCGTGRPNAKTAPSLEAAIDMGGEDPPVFDPEPLLDAFPRDLWGAS